MSIVQSSKVASILSRVREPEPSCLDDLVRRMRYDYQIQLAERVIQSQGKQAKVTISAQGGDERAKKLAASLEALFYKSRKSMWDMVAYGRVAFEKQWGIKDQLNVVSKLQPLPFRLSEMLPLKNGKYSGCRVGEGKEAVELTPRYSWWLALDPTAEYPHGQSRFAGSPYKTWRDRAELQRLRNIFIRKFVLKGAVIHAPEDKNQDGQQTDLWTRLAGAYSDYQSGALIIFPSDRAQGSDGKEGDYIYDLQEMPGEARTAQPLIDLTNALDAEQLLSFTIPPKTVMEGSEVGAFALVTLQMLIMTSMVEEIIEQQVESFQEQVINDAVSVNFTAPPEELILATFTPLAERPDDLATQIVTAWLSLPQLSPLLLSGAIDIEAVLESVGIPVSAAAKGKVMELVTRLQASQDAMKLQTAQANAERFNQQDPKQAEMAHPFLTRT